MARYDKTFVDRLLEPWNRHDVDGALALMPDDCVWDQTRCVAAHPRAANRGQFYACRLNAARS
jgi:hypothetical protein